MTNYQTKLRVQNTKRTYNNIHSVYKLMNINIKSEIPFFISFMGRSGSSFLVSLLSDHPEIVCRGEIFGLSPEKKKKFSDNEAIIKGLNNIYSGKTKANGFKFKYPGQYDYYSEIYKYLLSYSDVMRVIFLYRKNRLKAAISRQNLTRLTKMGKKANLDESSFVKLDKLNLDINQALRNIDKRIELDEKYRNQLRNFKYTYTVAYEDLYSNTQSIMENIYSFLQVDSSHQASGTTRKITDDNFANSISNYDELSDKIKSTKYETYLQ